MGSGPVIGVVVGLRAEAAVAARWGAQVGVGGGTAAGAARAAAALAPEVEALVSFGLAGALDPALGPGTLLVPALVEDAGECWRTDAALCARLGGCTGHVLRGGGAVLATAAAKAAARAATGADAVDLESAAVARAAAVRGLPFAALRAVCDPADQDLPRAALAALDGGGRIGVLRVGLAVLRRPGEVPALLALGRQAAAARRALLARVAATAL